jgi:CHAD domain-containing protein
MADEKWISGLHGIMPVGAAAQLVLGNRLAVVRDRLPAAVFQSHLDVEHVHQLRVGTRRAGAALRIFAECLPARLHERTRKTLKKLRRSAGAARDWDVFHAMVEPRLAKAPAQHKGGLFFLVGYAQGNRDIAQAHLLEAHREHADAFGACIEDIAAALERTEQNGPTLRDLASRCLADLVGELESAARADLQSYAALHHVRILGKQLRYAMEIFECCYPGEFRSKHYAAVEEMQEILGLANDSYTAWERLTLIRTKMMNSHPAGWSRCKGGIEALLTFHESRLPLQRRKFEKWWRAWLKSGAEKAFVSLVGGV